MPFSKLFSRCVLGTIFLLNSVPVGAAESSLNEATRSCFVSTCGKDYVFKHPFELSLQTQLATQVLTDKTLKRPIELMMGRAIHQAVVSNGIYEKLSKMKLANLEGPAKGLLLSLYYAQKLPTYVPTLVADKEGKLVFDREKLKALPEKLTEGEISAISSLKDLISFFTGQSIFTVGLSYRQLLKYLYPQKSLIESEKLEAQEILKNFQVLGQTLPGFKVFSEVDLVLTRALAGSVLSEAELSHMQGLTTSRYIYSVLFQPSVQSEFQSLPFNFDEMMQKIYLTYQVSKKATAVKNPKTIKNILQTGVSECSAYLSYAYAALPTQNQIQTFKGVLKNIEATAQLMIEEKTQTSLAGNFDFEVSVPTAQEQVMPDWVAYLNLATQETEKRIKAESALDLSDPSVQATAMIMMLGDSKSDLFESVSSFCHQSTPPFLDDAFLRTDNSIQLSWPTIVHPEVGAAIIAHEIGHAIQNKWPGTILSENICLMGKQGSSQYLTEDFADLFSGEIMRRLGGKINGLEAKNLGCGLVQPKEDRGLLTLNNPSKNDSHSSALYRIFSASALQNNRTKECSAYLVLAKDTRFDQYCQWGK